MKKVPTVLHAPNLLFLGKLGQTEHAYARVFSGLSEQDHRQELPDDWRRYFMSSGDCSGRGRDGGEGGRSGGRYCRVLDSEEMGEAEEIEEEEYKVSEEAENFRQGNEGFGKV
ncbi:hypothetical protein LR48_Vigan543s002100 [Vigna angularis]|uniref:Uncharacterized protein n=1 Tax=Phaseolus angularis TaxID=3914 RepID=A0A0L9TD18_PHAAN|nr:uncharacterized protein HKW66_Vig0170880 [Vigna angularis]KOM28433.1 hypothetical protein LR48_Vigan543s002100 [Vigna angularis]